MAGPLPEAVRVDFALDPFYRRHVDAGGLPVLSSGAPDDAALLRACRLVVDMLSKRPDVRDKLIELRARFVVIGRGEGTTDIPEYGFAGRSPAERAGIDARTRGIGGQASSCGEENLMCLAGDRYAGQSVCVHEFSHTIREAVIQLDPGFDARLRASYAAAMARGILAGTYRATSHDEYWAVGVQDWYDANAEADPPDGTLNAVNTREELQAFDPALHALVGEVFPVDARWEDCRG